MGDDLEAGGSHAEWMEVFGTQRMWSSFIAMDADEMDFRVDRPANDDPGVSFSSESFEALSHQMMAFIGARVMRKWEEGKTAPKHLTIRLSLEIK